MQPLNIRHFLAVGFIIWSSLSNACSCPPIGKISQADLDETSVFFVGEVVSIAESEAGKLVVVFYVDEIWSEDSIINKTRKITLTTNASSSMCGLSFSVNERWFIQGFQSDTNGRISSNICSRSTQLSISKPTYKRIGWYRYSGRYKKKERRRAKRDIRYLNRHI